MNIWALVCLLCLVCSIRSINTYAVPYGGNAWPTTGGSIDSDGYTFTSSPAAATSYVYVSKAGAVTLSLSLKNSGPLDVNVRVAGVGITKRVKAASTDIVSINIGKFNFAVGYIPIVVKITSNKGKGKGASASGTLLKLDLVGTDDSFEVTYYAADDTDNWFYWTRRGPSCHLTYDISAISNIKYFYNEITVPTGLDTIGSYFMAIGFDQGYFGIQVNSATERRVLFSVWSGFTTDDPSKIPADFTVKLEKKGDGVTVGQFGGEGSGGQSYFVYNWKANTKYGFLTQAIPNDSTGATTYTAWFNSPDIGSWKLIAQWTRPKIVTSLTGIYSFIENFDTNYGDKTRKANYGNQWAYDGTKQVEITGAYFTVDSTGNDHKRRDFNGGLDLGNSVFFLQNTGFFNETGTPYQSYTRTSTTAPTIDFTSLP